MNIPQTTDLPTYYISDISNDEDLTFTQGQQLTKVNKGLKSLPITKSEVIEWVGYEGDTVNGVLYYPEKL